MQIIRHNLLNPSSGPLDSPETLVPINETTHHIPEDHNINMHHRQNPKYVMVRILFSVCEGLNCSLMGRL
jgi:hypothetical protein